MAEIAVVYQHGEPEICDFGGQVVVQKNVARLHIPVDYRRFSELMKVS